MKQAQLFALIEGLRTRGVLHIKLESGLEMSIAPELPGGPAPATLGKELDKSKCLDCQIGEPQPKYGGLCRGCWFKQAGVAS